MVSSGVWIYGTHQLIVHKYRDEVGVRTIFGLFMTNHVISACICICRNRLLVPFLRCGHFDSPSTIGLQATCRPTASLKQRQAANSHAVSHSQQPALVFTNFVCNILLKCRQYKCRQKFVQHRTPVVSQLSGRGSGWRNCSRSLLTMFQMLMLDA